VFPLGLVGCSHGAKGAGASGKCKGISASERASSSRSSSKVPAHMERRVKGVLRLNSLPTVAATDVSSNCDVLKGPCFGSWNTAFGTLPPIRRAAERPPNRRKSNLFGKPSLYSLHGASGAGTPSCGGMT
jgi:hypothetical protein